MNLIDLSGSGSARAEDAQGTPTQSHISPSKFQYTKIKAGSPEQIDRPSTSQGELKQVFPTLLFVMKTLPSLSSKKSVHSPHYTV